MTNRLTEPLTEDLTEPLREWLTHPSVPSRAGLRARRRQETGDRKKELVEPKSKTVPPLPDEVASIGFGS